ASIIIAYLLEGVVEFLMRLRIPRFLAVLIVFSAFMAFLMFLIFGLLPLLSRQATQLFQQLPNMIARGQDALLTLPERYPQLFSEAQVRDLISSIRSETLAFGQRVVTISFASVVGIIAWIVYLILMPLMVFFFMKDKDQIVNWMTGFLPKDRTLLGQVWRDVDLQIGNYVRGKFVEIIIVWVVTYITFAAMGLQFSMLLGVLVGLSVLIPYIGAVTVTIPVAVVAYFQWGFTADFAWLLAAYAIIQALDGNLLVPLLFSEAVNLHPVAIIVAILIFGGLWGFWGVFFAIPLATLVQAVLKAWPRLTSTGPPEGDASAA
ncbi:MAG: AI-2E family transporter, partial [Gammaproteobacteria bacterium]|nr:AI-2E family transporter [Gammaproteobacteria bacterium]